MEEEEADVDDARIGIAGCGRSASFLSKVVSERRRAKLIMERPATKTKMVTRRRRR